MRYSVAYGFMTSKHSEVALCVGFISWNVCVLAISVLSWLVVCESCVFLKTALLQQSRYQMGAFAARRGKLVLRKSTVGRE